MTRFDWVRRAPARHALRLLAFTAPAWCSWAAQVVAGPSGQVDAALIRQSVEHHATRLLEEAPVAEGANRIEVRAGALDSRLSFQACAGPLEVELDATRMASRNNARVSCDAPSPWYLYVPVELAVYRDVVVATRPMRPGEIIGAGDVSLQERDVLRPSSPGLGRLEDAIGLELRRAVAANAVIGSGAVDLPLLVRRGDRISLGSRAGGLVVSVNGEALGNGRRGERIRVRNLQSQRVVEATVTGPGRAEVI